MDYTALHTEFITDPMALGYGQWITGGVDSRLALIINSALNSAQIPVTFVPSPTVFEAIVPTEWAAVSSANKQLIQTILGMDNVFVTGTNTRTVFTQAFGPATQTRINLLALTTRTASRAEALFGEGANISPMDVAKAFGRG